MLKRIVNINSVEYTIDREIARSLLNKIKEDVLRDENTRVYFVTSSEEDDFTASENLHTNKTLMSRTEVTYEKTTKGEYKYTNMLLRNNKNLLLLDTDHCLQSRLNTTYTTYTFNIKYMNRSKSAVLKVISLLKNLSNQDAAYVYADLDYYWYIPVPLLALLKDIYYKVTGNTDYYTYLEEIAQVPIDYVSMRDGDFKAPVIREQQPSVYATVDGDLYDLKPSKEDTWYYVEFTVTLELEVPSSMFIEYPILVNNQPIDEKFLPKDKFLEYVENGSIYDLALSRITSYQTSFRTMDAIIRYPTYDEFSFPIELPYGSFRLASFLLTVDVNDLTLVLSMDELSSIISNTEVMDYIKTRYGNSLFKFGEDLFHFELYENCSKPDKGLYLDENGVIRTSETNPLDPTKFYHLTMDVIWDLTLLDNIDLHDTTLDDYINLLKSINVTDVPIELPSQFKVNYFTILAYLLGESL